MEILRFENFFMNESERIEKTNELLAKDMETPELKQGSVYKVFDKEKNGALVYSAARFDGLEKEGNKFTLVNKPKEIVVFIKPEEMKHLVLTPGFFKK